MKCKTQHKKDPSNLPAYITQGHSRAKEWPRAVDKWLFHYLSVSEYKFLYNYIFKICFQIKVDSQTPNIIKILKSKKRTNISPNYTVLNLSPRLAIRTQADAIEHDFFKQKVLIIIVLLFLGFQCANLIGENNHVKEPKHSHQHFSHSPVLWLTNCSEKVLAF